MYTATADSAGDSRARRRFRSGSVWSFLCVSALLMFSAIALTACSGKTEEEYLSEANAMMQEQNLLKATILYKEFLQRFPDSQNKISAQMGLAEAYYRNKEYELCREMLDAIITANGGPANPAGFQAYLTKLRTFGEEGKFAEGLASAEATSNSLSSAPLPMKQAFQMFLGTFYAQNAKPQEAVDVFNSILSTQPKTVEDELFQHDILMRSASIYEIIGRTNEVVPMLNDYLATHPNVGTRGMIEQSAGRVEIKLGNHEEADKHYDLAQKAFTDLMNASDKEENKVRFEIALANLNMIRGRNEQAEADLRTIVDKYPNSSGRATAMNLLASSRARAQDYETALGLLQQIVQNYPNTREAQSAIQKAQQIVAMRQRDQATTATATPAMVTEKMPLSGDTGTSAGGETEAPAEAGAESGQN